MGTQLQLLYEACCMVLSWRKRTVINWSESYEQKKASCAHSCLSFILPCAARLVTNLERRELSMLFSGESFGEQCGGVTSYSEGKLKNFSLQVCCPMHRYPLLVQLLCLILPVFGNLRYNYSKEQSSLNAYQWLPSWCSLWIFPLKY